MSESISWSLSAASPSGTGVSAAGSTKSDAMVYMSKEVEASSSDTEILLQIDNVAKVVFLAIECTLLDESVTIKADIGDPKKLTGPLLLFGESVTLFANDLTKLTVKNTSANTAATINVLIGLNV